MAEDPLARKIALLMKTGEAQTLDAEEMREFQAGFREHMKTRLEEHRARQRAALQDVRNVWVN